MGIIKAMPVPVPVLDRQREFAARVATVSAQRVAAQRAATAEDELFASLQARAFLRQALMGNFDFVQMTLPHGPPRLRAGPSRTCRTTRARRAFYSRRAVEVLVAHLYDVLALPRPYKDDLAARINEAAFTATAGRAITQKLTLIRKLGNTAVHDPEAHPAARRAAGAPGAAPRHGVGGVSATPRARRRLPTQAQFDPALAAQARPAVAGGGVETCGAIRGPGRGPRESAGREGRARR